MTQAKLDLKAMFYMHSNRVLSEDNPVGAYEIVGMPGGEVVQIRNHRAPDHNAGPLWRIHYVFQDVEIGQYKTAEEALTFMQQLVDDPNGIIHFFHKAETAWMERWGHEPGSEAAKHAYRNDVGPWKRLYDKFGNL